MKNIIIIQGHAIVTIGWCSNNTHVVGISPTRGKWINRPFFFSKWFITKTTITFGQNSWSILDVENPLGYPHTHTSSSVGFNKNKSEKAFLWTKRSPRECNSNWPMLPFPPSLLSYTAAGYSIEKILNFFLVLEGCTAKHLAVIFWTCSFDSSISPLILIT